MNFRVTVTMWQSLKIKEWETVGEAKIFIMSWYCMWFMIGPYECKTLAKISIGYLSSNYWYHKIHPFFSVNWYLNTMLNHTKKKLENKIFKRSKEVFRHES